MNKIINFPVHLNKKIVLDYLVPFFIFLIFFIIGLNVYKDYGISFDETHHRENGRLYYYFLKGFFINLDLSEKVFVSDIKAAIQEFEFWHPGPSSELPLEKKGQVHLQ